MGDNKDLENLDLYGLFDISPNAEKAEIKKAYRKKALSCHPDKNPDNPDAAALFHQLSRAQDLLLNDVARGIYDRKLKAKHAAQLRNRELDDERKRFKQKLEEQELSAEQEKKDDLLQRKIRILREQAKREAEEEDDRNKQERTQRLQEHYLSFCRIRLSWKASKTDPTNGGYNENKLKEIFSPYGEIEAMVIPSGKKGRALIEFADPEAAKRAVLMATGISSNPLKMKILGAAAAEDRKQKIQSMMYNSASKCASSQSSTTAEEDQE
ncbi:dnaJ homolog subfamily C member 17 [Planococcus citri]|uniref:dnaJ homolog subfamily C member 17 n=1 Tax=Planococcus citri TaxID=170843 RepID=UPI0031F76412